MPTASTPKESQEEPPGLLEPPGSIARRVEAWFPKASRDLPWRRHRSPWRSLVSELMLQQTQVSRVAERFEPFMAAFPEPAVMAAAGEDAVLARWEGMGYYRRARLLHAAAVAIVERHGGEVPDDPVALLALPGVGRYTAGSVASIAFGRPEPIVDGNVIRVLARLLAVDARSDEPRLVDRCWRQATTLAEAAEDPGVFNEGLMELGATVCTPAGPKCDACPVAEACRGRRAGLQDTIPRPKQRPRRTPVHLDLVVIRDGDLMLLEQRSRGGLWGGLWQPPGLESPDPSTPASIRVELERRGLLDPARPKLEDDLVRLGGDRRLLTHREVHLTLWRWRPPATGRSTADSALEGRWVDRIEAVGLGMARPVRTLVEAHAWSDEPPLG